MTGRPTSRRAQLAFGAVFVVIGVGLVAMMTVSPQGLRVPYGIAVVAAAAFALAGLSVMAQALRWSRLGQLFAVAVVFCLAAPGLWTVIDPATQTCTASFGVGDVAASDLTCRVVFGAGGAVTLAVSVVAAWAFVRRFRAGRYPAAMPMPASAEEAQRREAAPQHVD